ncbi:50S ribosomal protein L15e [Candidatus Woesearchaeota archaeon]|nr:50S ribosomal protein L15e [Candidatus Woesearchaeota archaeon]
MTFYSRLKDFYTSNEARKIYQQNAILWRQEPTIVKLEYPTRLDKARSLGYKAKQGIVVVRVRLRKSKRLRPTIRKGRRSKHRRRKKVINKNFRLIAEERVARKYTNMEVLNSYYVFEDGKYKWFEIILVDKNHPSIKADKTINWITKPQHTRRVFRGLTSAGKKSRGLLGKGKGREKIRPSLASNLRRAH